MNENIPILEQAAQSLTNKSISSPSSTAVVEALLAAEKTARKNRVCYNFEQLQGNWRLCFITGTKKTRQQAGVVMGAGRYIPQWVTIQLTYSPQPLIAKTPETHQSGTIENIVQLAGLQLTLSGPSQFLVAKNLLAFDFTRIKLQTWGATLYQGFIRGGKAREEKFAQENVSQKAFFTYFLVQEKLIAARGKGGGLALWVK